ncbi:MAG: hypothetical protein IT305_13920 [Chloroflexi bacterium]|nr:hypothetical protein [Chloroflexota bacterium]
MILLADANVLIDLGYVNGLAWLCALAPVEVLDIVLAECQHGSQPDLVPEIKRAGVQTVATDSAWLPEALPYHCRGLSLNDALNLYYARRFGRVLLAGDKPLRDRCGEVGVTVHGSLWVVEQLHQHSLVEGALLCGWLDVWPRFGRRLPPRELERLRRMLVVRAR